MTTRLFFAAACTAAVAGAWLPAAPAVASPSRQSTAAPPSVAAEPAPLPDIVARVNGEAIERTDLEAAIRQLEARAGRAVPAGERDRMLLAMLDQLIAYRLLVQESRGRNVVVAEADIDARIGDIRSQFPSDEVFQQALEDRQTTLASLRADLRESMQIDELLAQHLASSVITVEQVEQFYADNPAEFQQGERVRASHILIRMAAEADAAARDRARAQAAAILAEVKGGKDFDALARQHSEDPGSASDGGDLGYFERGQMVGPFEEAAFSLPPSQTSDLVESPFGYHIIKVIDRQPARTIPLADVRPQVEEFLRIRQREEQTEMFIDLLRSKGQIDIYLIP